MEGRNKISNALNNSYNFFKNSMEKIMQNENNNSFQYVFELNYNKVILRGSEDEVFQKSILDVLFVYKDFIYYYLYYIFYNF